MIKTDVVVVGSGIAGSTAARILAEQGKSVLVIEKRAHIGGNCFDFKNELGITVHKYGPHIFHTNDDKVWSFLNAFTEFNMYEHAVLSYIEGKLIQFPINRNTICDIFDVNIPDDKVREFLQYQVSQSSFNEEILNFEDAVISQVGDRLYNLFFKNYTIKQWDKNPKNLSADIARRIPVRENSDNRYFTDKFQGMPSNGYSYMFYKMLEHANIKVFLNTDYFDIKDSIESKLIVYTGELDRYFDYRFGKLEYRSLEFDYEIINKEYHQPVSVVNYPNDHKWTRISEFKYFLSEKSDKTIICYETPVSKGDPYYVVLTDDNIKLRKKYINEVKKLESTNKFLFVGRLAEYKYYNIDQIVAECIKKVCSWLADETF